eukprot:3789606-Pyramimonas_sp.AAC.1
MGPPEGPRTTAPPAVAGLSAASGAAEPRSSPDESPLPSRGSPPAARPSLRSGPRVSCSPR